MEEYHVLWEFGQTDSQGHTAWCEDATKSGRVNLGELENLYSGVRLSSLSVYSQRITIVPVGDLPPPKRPDWAQITQ